MKNIEQFPPPPYQFVLVYLKTAVENQNAFMVGMYEEDSHTWWVSLCRNEFEDVLDMDIPYHEVSHWQELPICLKMLEKSIDEMVYVDGVNI